MCAFVSRAACWLLLAGSRPGRRGTFLCFATGSPAEAKYPKERRPSASVPAASPPGNLWCSVMGCAAELAAGRWPSAQTAAASQSTKFGRSTATKRSPCPVLLGAGRRGLDSRTSNGLLESCFLNRYLVIYAAGAHLERVSSYQKHRNQQPPHPSLLPQAGEGIKHPHRAQHSPIKKLSRYSGPQTLLHAPRSTGRGLSSCIAECQCHVI